jgi:hypothetical protein
MRFAAQRWVVDAVGGRGGGRSGGMVSWRAGWVGREGKVTGRQFRGVDWWEGEVGEEPAID